MYIHNFQSGNRIVDNIIHNVAQNEKVKNLNIASNIMNGNIMNGDNMNGNIADAPLDICEKKKRKVIIDFLFKQLCLSNAFFFSKICMKIFDFEVNIFLEKYIVIIINF